MDQVLEVAGERWATAEVVCARAGITRQVLDVWVHRGKVRRPVRVDGIGYYLLDEVLDAEVATATSKRGGRKRSGT
jgi:hypothetical protein